MFANQTADSVSTVFIFFIGRNKCIILHNCQCFWCKFFVRPNKLRNPEPGPGRKDRFQNNRFSLFEVWKSNVNYSALQVAFAIYNLWILPRNIFADLVI